jgi:hypothetical protein
MLAHELRYATVDGQNEIVVPRGFVTDLASIPSALWWWEAPHEATLAPAIIHDYLYWDQSCSKDEADAVMYLAMLDVGLGMRRRNLIYAGVRTPIAQSAWNNNMKLRADGELRFFTDSYSDDIMEGNMSPKTTLIDIQRAAIALNGMTAQIPNSSLKSTCKNALDYYRQL